MYSLFSGILKEIVCYELPVTIYKQENMSDTNKRNILAKYPYAFQTNYNFTPCVFLHFLSLIF